MKPGTNERAKPAFEEFVTVFDVQGRLGEIRMPTLIVAGGQDPLVPLSECELLHAGIADSEFVVLTETGHGLGDWESADGRKYRAAVQHFLSGIGSLSLV